MFRKLDKGTNLDYILCSKISRKIDNGSAFSYKNNYYRLVSGGKVAVTIPRSRVSVLISARIGIKALYSGKVYSVAKLEARPKVVKNTQSKIRQLHKKPVASHPWKSSGSDGFRYDKRDERLALGLYDSTIAWETK